MNRIALLAWLIGVCCVGTAWAWNWIGKWQFDRQMDRIRQEWRFME
jgi:hypothetical protein